MLLLSFSLSMWLLCTENRRAFWFLLFSDYLYVSICLYYTLYCSRFLLEGGVPYVLIISAFLYVQYRHSEFQYLCTTIFFILIWQTKNLYISAGKSKVWCFENRCFVYFVCIIIAVIEIFSQFSYLYSFETIVKNNNII